LEDLESYSLKSSEEINDFIESLMGCINSNSEALDGSLNTLVDKRNKVLGFKNVD
jgi:hypothetical protein